jgi:hypothetical protein
MRHAAVVAGLNREVEAKTATIADMAASHAAAVAAVEAENAALKAQVAANLTELIATVKAGLAFEILPVRPDDGRRFAVSHEGPVPPLPPKPTPPPPPPPPPVPDHLTFDRAWCAAVCEVEREFAIHCGTRTPWRIVHPGGRCLMLRSTGPLPRLLPGQSPGYRIIVQSYGGNADCRLGFVPSHVLDSEGVAPVLVDVEPTPNRAISNFGGWYIEVRPLEYGTIIDATRCGWIVLPPPFAAPQFNQRGGRPRQPRRTSSYATTKKVPPLSAGGAVEFVVDHAAGTCRVAFYTPAAVWNNFETPPFARMELCFVATAAHWECAIPARMVPTVPISRVELYPAVEADHAGAIWRLVPLEVPDDADV